MKPHRAVLSLELLEPRDAPATMVSATKLTYQDIDGDDVAVSFSKPVLTAANVNFVFTFNNGNVSANNATKQQLQKIDFKTVGFAGAGTAITTSATRNAVTGGDGFAAVGEIIANGINLGMVTIDGDIVHVDAGSATGIALQSLTANSMGLYSTTTEKTGSQVSSLNGSVGSIHVSGEAVGVSFAVQVGGIGSIWIGGSYRGDPIAGAITTVAGDIGQVKVGGDFIGDGRLVGGNSVATGWINCAGNLAGLTVGGSLIGSNYDLTNHRQIYCAGKMGPVRIGGDVIGRFGVNGASVQAGGSIASVAIGGSIAAGENFTSRIESVSGDIGPVIVGGDVGEFYSPLAGPVGADSANITALGRIASVVIGGSLIASQTAKHVASVNAFAIGRVTVGHDLRGGTNEGAQIVTVGDIGPVTIGGSLIGGFGPTSGTVGGRGLGVVTIAGSIVGGGGTSSGLVSATTTLAGVNVGGSIIGGGGLRAGAIKSYGVLGPVTVKGNIVGTLAHPVEITARGLVPPSKGPDIAITSIHVFGRVEYADIRAGWFIGNSPADADAQIGQVTVDGSWLHSSVSAGVSPGANGFFGDADDAKLSGVGISDQPLVTSRIAAITIGGQVAGLFTNGLHFGFVAETIGAVRIGGTPLLLHAGSHNDNIQLGLTGDFNVLEV